MTEPSLTTLNDIGDEIEGRHKWSSFVDGEDGFFYGIPCDARRVVKVGVQPSGCVVYEPTTHLLCALSLQSNS
jgi:hypothetical protein